MTPASIGLILLVLVTLGRTKPDHKSDLLRKTINSAAGMEIIPQDTQFQLSEIHGASHYECKDFPGGGRACVSGSAYTTGDGPVMVNGKVSYSSGAKSNLNNMVFGGQRLLKVDSSTIGPINTLQGVIIFHYTKGFCHLPSSNPF